MSRKVFISFLGTSNYSEVKYQLGRDNPITTRFVQIATYQYLCNDFKNEDKVLIFTTPTAKNVNWFDNGHKNYDTKETIQCDGLKSCFERNGLNIDSIDIPEGKSENEIWEIFQIVYNQLMPNDEVIFDITHSFRSIPMLNMVLINYAKVLKNISVAGIHYGAYEVENEIKPIWNLISFSELQDWTLAVSGLVKFGNSSEIKKLAQQEVLPILQNKDDLNNAMAQELVQLAKSVEFVTDALATNRGDEIVGANIFNNLQKNIKTLSNSNFIPPFKPIIDLIHKKTERFNVSKDIMNGFVSVEWCIDHNLIPQGYTMLQESIFTYYCHLAGLDFKLKDNRDLVLNAFHNINHNKIEKNRNVFEIMNIIPKEMASLYESMTQDRNDISHGGFTRFESSKNLKDKLKRNFEKCKNILNF
jgi:CRISPR-associated Csx2 family protein